MYCGVCSDHFNALLLLLIWFLNNVFEDFWPSQHCFIYSPQRKPQNKSYLSAAQQFSSTIQMNPFRIAYSSSVYFITMQIYLLRFSNERTLYSVHVISDKILINPMDSFSIFKYCCSTFKWMHIYTVQILWNICTTSCNWNWEMYRSIHEMELFFFQFLFIIYSIYIWLNWYFHIHI